MRTTIGVVDSCQWSYFLEMEPPVEQTQRERVYRDILRWFEGMKSENVGGLVSMAGSCLFLLGGDRIGFFVAFFFLIAEVILARFGHTRAGYSAGCLLFAYGDGLAVASEVARGNGVFQISLGIMAAAWLVGAMRAPLAWFGERENNDALIAAADALQPIAGIATLALRFPGIAAAISGASYVGAAAIVCWAASDILVGRLQDMFLKHDHTE